MLSRNRACQEIDIFPQSTCRVSLRFYRERYIHEVKTKERMIFLKFLAIFASASASECPQGNVFYSVFGNQGNPVNQSCEKSGLVWKGRDRESFLVKDQFFTKWTDLFFEPKCVGRIEVYILEMWGPWGKAEREIPTPQDFTKVDEARRNPSNTILIYDQPEGGLCQQKIFRSRIVFFPKHSNNKDLPCFELRRKHYIPVWCALSLGT